MSEVTKLQKGQVKLLEQTMRISEEIKELKQLMLKLSILMWKKSGFRLV